MNKEIIKQFEILQMYFRKRNDVSRTIAYTKAIKALRNIDRKINNFSNLKNIELEPKVIDKIREYLDTGRIQAVEIAKKELKMEDSLSLKENVMLDLQTIWGIDPKNAEMLYNQGIYSIKDLEKHKKLLTESQAICLKYREDLLKKIPRNYITSLYVIMMYYINKKYGSGNYDMIIAGSYRRGDKESKDIDCIISSKKFNLQEVVQLLKKEKIIVDVLSMEEDKFTGIANCNLQKVLLNIKFVDETELAYALLHFTGSKSTNIYMRDQAKRKGMLLSEHGLVDSKTQKKILENPTEKEIFEKIGISYISPELR